MYDPSQIEAAIDATADALSAVGDKRHDDLTLDGKWWESLRSAARPITLALERTEPFKSWSSPMFNTGLGGLGIAPMFFGPDIALVVIRHGSEFTKAAVRKLLTLQTAERELHMHVWGLAVPGESLDLGDGLIATPVDQQEVWRRRDEWRAMHWPAHRRLTRLTRTYEVAPLLSDVDETSSTQFASAADLLTRGPEEVLALTCLGTTPIVIEETWAAFKDPHLAALLLRVGKWHSLHEVVSSQDAEPIELTEAARLHLDRYRALNKPDRERMNFILERLSAAQRRSSPSNKALDAGIALETLLTSAKEQPGSATYKLALRGALFLGKTLDERTAVRKAISDVYGLRSKAAHGAGRQTNTRDTETANIALDLCARIARQMISQGGPPSWPQLELAPPPLEVGLST